MTIVAVSNAQKHKPQSRTSYDFSAVFSSFDKRVIGMSEIPIYEISAVLGHCLEDLDTIVSKIQRNDHNNHNNAILVSSNVH